MAQGHESEAPLSAGEPHGDTSAGSSPIDPLSVAQSGWVNPDDVEEETPSLRGRLRGRQAPPPPRRNRPASPLSSSEGSGAGDPLSVLANAIDSGTTPTEAPDEHRRRWFGRRAGEPERPSTGRRTDEGGSEFDVHNLVGPVGPLPRPVSEEEARADAPAPAEKAAEVPAHEPAEAAEQPVEAEAPAAAADPAPPAQDTTDPLAAVWSGSELHQEPEPPHEPAERAPEEAAEPQLLEPRPLEPQPAAEELAADELPPEEPTPPPAEAAEEEPVGLAPRLRGRFARRMRPAQPEAPEQAPAAEARADPQAAEAEFETQAPATRAAEEPTGQAPEAAEAPAQEPAQEPTQQPAARTEPHAQPGRAAAQDEPWDELYEPEEYVAGEEAPADEPKPHGTDRHAIIGGAVAGTGIAAAAAAVHHDAHSDETAVLPTVPANHDPAEPAAQGESPETPTAAADQPATDQDDSEHVWTAEELAAEGWTTADLRDAGWTDEDLDSIGWPAAPTAATPTNGQEAPVQQDSGTPDERPDDTTTQPTTPPASAAADAAPSGRDGDEPLTFDDNMPEEEPLTFDDEARSTHRSDNPTSPTVPTGRTESGQAVRPTSAADDDEEGEDSEPAESRATGSHRATRLLAGAAGVLGAGALASRLGGEEKEPGTPSDRQPTDEGASKAPDPAAPEHSDEPGSEHPPASSPEPAPQAESAAPAPTEPSTPASTAAEQPKEPSRTPVAPAAAAAGTTAATTDHHEDKPAEKIPNFVEYRPTDVRRLALGTGFVVVAVLAIFHAVQSPGAGSIILAIAVVVLAGALWWGLLSVPATVVTIGRGVVEIAHGPASQSFDLRASGTDAELGDPHASSWQAVLRNAEGETATLNAHQVPPGQFTRLVEHWRSQPAER